MTLPGAATGDARVISSLLLQQTLHGSGETTMFESAGVGLHSSDARREACE